MLGGTIMPWWHGNPVPGATTVPPLSFHDKAPSGFYLMGAPLEVFWGRQFRLPPPTLKPD